MKVKDIVKIAILSVVGFVLSMIGAMAAPLLGNYSFAGEVAFGAVLSGTVFYTLTQKVPKRGVVFLYYLINALAYVLTGFWPLSVILLIAGIAAELSLIPVASYYNPVRITISFILSTIIYGLHGLFFFGLIGADRIASAFLNMYTADSVATLSKYLLSPVPVFVLIIVLAVCAFIGAFIGRSIYNRFFSGNAKKQERGLE